MLNTDFLRLGAKTWTSNVHKQQAAELGVCGLDWIVIGLEAYRGDEQRMRENLRVVVTRCT